MKITAPKIYGANMSVALPPETITGQMSKASRKAKPRFPHTPLTNQPGGGGKTSGKFTRALTPGTSPEGS